VHFASFLRFEFINEYYDTAETLSIEKTRKAGLIGPGVDTDHLPSTAKQEDKAEHGKKSHTYKESIILPESLSDSALLRPFYKDDQKNKGDNEKNSRKKDR
jgi:hypothetical protein